MFKIVLYQPEIPGNTGSIGRTCLALGLELILIRPYGFSVDEKSVRRAGLDYWKNVNLKEYDDWESFLESEKPNQSDLLYLSKTGESFFYDAPISNNSYIVFGSETKGLPKELLNQEQCYRLPIDQTHVRSLNLSNAATACAYIALPKVGIAKNL